MSSASTSHQISLPSANPGSTTALPEAHSPTLTPAASLIPPASTTSAPPTATVMPSSTTELSTPLSTATGSATPPNPPPIQRHRVRPPQEVIFVEYLGTWDWKGGSVAAKDRIFLRLKQMGFSQREIHAEFVARGLQTSTNIKWVETRWRYLRDAWNLHWMRHGRPDNPQAALVMPGFHHGPALRLFTQHANRQRAQLRTLDAGMEASVTGEIVFVEVVNLPVGFRVVYHVR